MPFGPPPRVADELKYDDAEFLGEAELVVMEAPVRELDDWVRVVAVACLAPASARPPLTLAVPAPFAVPVLLDNLGHSLASSFSEPTRLLSI